MVSAPLQFLASSFLPVYGLLATMYQIRTCDRWHYLYKPVSHVPQLPDHLLCASNSASVSSWPCSFAHLLRFSFSTPFPSFPPFSYPPPSPPPFLFQKRIMAGISCAQKGGGKKGRNCGQVTSPEWNLRFGRRLVKSERQHETNLFICLFAQYNKPRIIKNILSSLLKWLREVNEAKMIMSIPHQADEKLILSEFVTLHFGGSVFFLSFHWKTGQPLTKVPVISQPQVFLPRSIVTRRKWRWWKRKKRRRTTFPHQS